MNIMLSLLCLMALPAGEAVHHVVIVLDDSGSMGDALTSDPDTTKLKIAKNALALALKDIPEGSKIGLCLLNGQYDPDQRRTIRWWIPFGRVNKFQADQRIRSLKTNGGTPLGSAIKEGCNQLLEAKKTDLYGTYRLLIITDGEATGEEEVEKVNNYIPDIMSRGFITIDVIGLDMAQDHTLSQKVHNYINATDEMSLVSGIKSAFFDTFDSSEVNFSDPKFSKEYELIKALPDELAFGAIESLNDSGNYPVGQKPQEGSNVGFVIVLMIILALAFCLLAFLFLAIP